MASVTKQARVVDADAAWALIRDFGGATQAFPGMLADCTVEGNLRTVTFVTGNLVQERLVAIDEERRRIAYTVVGGRFTHHNASLAVTRGEDGSGTVTWITDLLPDEGAAIVEPLMEAGLKAFACAVQPD